MARRSSGVIRSLSRATARWQARVSRVDKLWRFPPVRSHSRSRHSLDSIPAWLWVRTMSYDAPPASRLSPSVADSALGEQVVLLNVDAAEDERDVQDAAEAYSAQAASRPAPLTRSPTRASRPRRADLPW